MAKYGQRRSFSFILGSYLLVFISIECNAMTLCEYYNSLGVYKPECYPVFLTNTLEEDEPANYQPPQEPEPSQSPFQFSFHRLPMLLTESYKTSAESEVSEVALPEYEDLGLCRGFFHSCYESDRCESGTICSQLTTTKQCCTSPNSQCPSPTELGFNCRKNNPTSWCYFDNDCNSPRTHKQMCCPTGCNYNICLPEKKYIPPNVGFQNIFRSAKMMSPDCPDPFSISMRCYKNNPTSWCNTHDDCPSFENALNPRRCCPTPCGYNACFIRFDGNWVIG